MELAVSRLHPRRFLLSSEFGSESACRPSPTRCEGGGPRPAQRLGP